MSRLGRFERKKSFMSAKNLLLFALLIASVLTLLIPGTIAYQKEQSKRRKSYSELSSAGWGSEDWGAAIRMSQLLNLYPSMDERPAEVEAELEVWRRDSHYSAARRVYMRWIGEDRWRDAVQAAIDQDTNIRDAMAAGIIDARLGGNAETLQELDNRIRKNQYLLDHDVRIISENADMTGFSFLRAMLQTLFPILFTGAIVAAAADCVASERDTGSFKFLLLQPFPRRRIFGAKLAASLLHTFFLTAVPLLVGFCSAALINGMGSAAYPIAYCADSYRGLLNTGYETGAVSYIGLSSWLIRLLPLLLCYLLFLTSFALFVSVAAKSGVTALTITITTTLASSVMRPYLTSIPVFSAVWPFSYADPSAVLSGEMQTTALLGIIVLLSFSAVLIFGSCMMFCREDVTC
mgnify:CR=1 FL=1